MKWGISPARAFLYSPLTSRSAKRVQARFGVDFYEGDAVGLVFGADLVPDVLVGRNGGRQGDNAVAGEQAGDIADAADIDVPIFFGERQPLDRCVRTSSPSSSSTR